MLKTMPATKKTTVKDDRKVITCMEAARHLSEYVGREVTYRTVFQWTRVGLLKGGVKQKLPYKRFGQRILLNYDELMRYVVDVVERPDM